MIKKIIISVVIVFTLALIMYSCGTCRKAKAMTILTSDTLVDQSELENVYYSGVIDCGNALYKDSSYSIQNYMTLDSISLMPINTNYNFVDNIPSNLDLVGANEFILFFPYATTLNGKTVVSLNYVYIPLLSYYEGVSYYQLNDSYQVGFTVNSNSNNMVYKNATCVKTVVNYENSSFYMSSIYDIYTCKSYIYMTNDNQLVNCFQFKDYNDNILLSMFMFFETDYAYTVSANERIYQPTVSFSYLDAFNKYYDIGYESGEETGYNNGFNYGYSVGYDDGFNNGYDSGYDIGNQDGYNIGYNSGFSDGEQSVLINSPFKVVVQGINDLLSIEILPNFKLGILIYFSIGLALVLMLVKVFK